MILIVAGGGVCGPLVCPAFPVGVLVVGSGGWWFRRWDRRPMVLCHRVIQAGSQGQWVGRCRIGLRWGRARRAGMLTR